MIKLLTAGALLGSQAASPPPVSPAPHCLTRQQIGDFGVVASSIILDVVSDVCRPHLGPSAFLSQPAGTAYLERLRVEAARRFPSAARLGASLFGGETISWEMTRIRVQQMAAYLPTLAGAGTIDPPLCREIDEIVEAMSPMSPDQVARFSAALLSLAQQLDARVATARAATAAAAEGDAASGDAAAPAPNPPGRPPLPPICPE